VGRCVGSGVGTWLQYMTSPKSPLWSSPAPSSTSHHESSTPPSFCTSKVSMAHENLGLLVATKDDEVEPFATRAPPELVSEPEE